MTFRVSDAVAEFFMPLSVSFFSPFVLGPFVLGPFVLAFDLSSSDEDLDLVVPFRSVAVGSPFVCLSAFFLRFLLPGAFFSAWVRPFSLSVLIRRLRRARSVGTVGSMGIMSFSAYGTLHCSR